MRSLLLTGLLVCGLLPMAPAAERSPLTAPRPDLRTVEEQIEAQLRRLSSDSFEERNEATRKLVELGLPAIEPVAEAAESLDMELSSRCVSILSRLSESRNAKVKSAALNALRQLKECDNPLLAKRAEAALPQPNQNVQARNGIIQLRIGGNLPVQNIQIQIQKQAVQGGRSVRTTIRNGVRETHVEEQGRQVQINDENGKNIRIKVTETKKGEKKTTEYNARDLDELKKNHPEGAKIYQEFTSEAPAVFGGVPAVPNLPQPPKQIQEQQKELEKQQQKIRGELEKGQREIKAITEKIRQNAARPGGPDPEVQQKLTEELREAQQKMIEAIRRHAAAPARAPE